MTGILKLLGSALLAVIAMSAVAATTASAGSIATDEYPSVLELEAGEGSASVFTATGGIVVECGEVIGGAGLEEEASSLTVNGGVAECIAGERLVTVEKSSCELEVGGLSGSGESWTGTGALSCPSGALAVHIYNGPGYTNTWCTTTFGSQSGLSGATVSNETNGGGSSDDTIAVEGALEEVAFQTHGACSAGLTLNLKGEIDLNLEVSATNIAGESIGARIE